MRRISGMNIWWIVSFQSRQIVKHPSARHEDSEELVEYTVDYFIGNVLENLRGIQ
jgi:hypothetical protein